MKDELIRKIGDSLKAGINTEKDLVYLLVEIRKLMDRDEFKDPILRCFCNWIVHTDLAIPSKGTNALLREFDESFDPSKKPNLSTEAGIRQWLCPPHGSFKWFRKHLQNFLKRYSLPTDLTVSEKRWGKFGNLYASIVSECPITIDPELVTPDVTLNYVEHIELSAPSEGQGPLTFLVWKVKLKNDSDIRVVRVMMS